MNDDSRKRLTGYLEECWHSPNMGPNGTWFCKILSCQRSLYSDKWTWHRTFTTWPDLGALTEKIVEKGEWRDFLYWVDRDNYEVPEGDKFPLVDFFAWLLNPTRFCELVDRWLEGKEKG